MDHSTVLFVGHSGGVPRNDLPPILALDFDSTITSPIGGPFSDEWKLNPLVGKLVETKVRLDERTTRNLKQDPPHLYIVSNQGGIPAGYTTHARFQNKVRKALEQIHPAIRAQVHYSVDRAGQAAYFRKPSTGMLHEVCRHSERHPCDVLFLDDMEKNRRAAGKEGFRVADPNSDKEVLLLIELYENW